MVLHSDNPTVTLPNTDYWAFAECQSEDKDHVTPYTTGTRTGRVQDNSGYEYNSTVALATCPSYSSLSELGDGCALFVPIDNLNPSSQANSKFVSNTSVPFPNDSFTLSF